MSLQGVRVSKSDILEAIHYKKGVVVDIAKHLGCTHETIYKNMREDPEVAEAIKRAREARAQERIEQTENLIDLAYDSARDLLLGKDVTMTIFTLKSKGKWEERNHNTNIIIEKRDRPYRTADTNDENTDSTQV